VSEKDAESQSKHSFFLYVKQLCVIYRNLISSFIPKIVAFYHVNLEAEEVFRILILTKLRAMLFRRHFFIQTDIRIAASTIHIILDDRPTISTFVCII
jgi:hypothetical protein